MQLTEREIFPGVYGSSAASTELDPSEFDNIIAVNYRGLWLCSREETKQMKTQEPLPTHDGRPGSRGAIVNIGSSLAIIPIPGKSNNCSPAMLSAGHLLMQCAVAPYASSKAAVIHMTKADALDVCSWFSFNLLFILIF